MKVRMTLALPCARRRGKTSSQDVTTVSTEVGLKDASSHEVGTAMCEAALSKRCSRRVETLSRRIQGHEAATVLVLSGTRRGSKSCTRAGARQPSFSASAGAQRPWMRQNLQVMRQGLLKWARVVSYIN
ncbi:hypothetical protein HAX54_018667 [Datura stramonium]|uniref:Uncharacterized protein n=1 Tax=Datura stramonium TaxID=4076 RepID=A0ABS8UMZ2_DATST|nr:hypothetical protein [Datura stramonium]